MSAPATRWVRWSCPNGCPSVLGPVRPRVDATCRVCLSCSANMGWLVKRSAPALERESERRRSQRERRAGAQRQREERKRAERAVRQRAAQARRRAWEDQQLRIAEAIALRSRRRPVRQTCGVEPWRSAAGAVMADHGYTPDDFRSKNLGLRKLEDWTGVARAVAVWSGREDHPSWKAWQRDVLGWEYALKQYRQLGLDTYDDRLPELAAVRVEEILREALGRGETPERIRRHAAAWITAQLESLMTGPAWARLTRPPRHRGTAGAART